MRKGNGFILSSTTIGTADSIVGMNSKLPTKSKVGNE
jgi:hypothetical protein